MGAIFEVVDENCLARLDSLEAGAGLDRGLACKDSMTEGLVEARVKVREGVHVADSLRSRRDTIDITEREGSNGTSGGL
jgi:hypothetical protein